MTRRWEFDALRGLMLVLMTLTHLPTRLAEPLGQPFGYVSAAEGFVLLSAFMAGMVYTRKGRRSGVPVMRRAFRHRALVIYGCQLLALLFLFTVIAVLGLGIDQPAAKNLMSFYLQHPFTALLAGLALVYQPPLLDILPLYILFMLISPWLLSHGMRHGWHGILALSLALWLVAQFGVTPVMYDWVVRHTGLPVPFTETGSFDTLAWQFIWVLGLWMGAQLVTAPQNLPPRARIPGYMVMAATALGLVGLVWRHAVGQVPFMEHAHLNVLFDKWLVGPLRLINLLALVTLTVRFGPWLKARLPRLRPLEALGRHSLPVFCAHLVAVLLVLAFFGEADPHCPWWEDITIVLISMGLMLAVAHAWPHLAPRTRAWHWRGKPVPALTSSGPPAGSAEGS
ncbi:MAG: OpgC domain-containing protein [Rubrivivax sp.]|nr:MAG: OpgC domain-containing protein [Rubrivivax sp.]